MHAPISNLSMQYPDTNGQQQLHEDLETQLAYWKQQLKDAPPLLQLPIDYSRSQVQTFNGATISLVLPQPLSEALKTLSQQQRVTLFTLLLAAFKTLLYRYTEQDDILVGTPVAHNQSESRLIGANTLILPRSR